jgi:hypothetical protein
MKRVCDDSSSSFGKFFIKLARAMNRVIVTKENNELIHVVGELPVRMQGCKENIYDIAVKRLHYGVDCSSNFDNATDVISDTCAKTFLSASLGAINMGHYASPEVVTQHKGVLYLMYLSIG